MDHFRAHVDAVLFDLDGTLIDTDNEAVEQLSRRLRPLVGRRALRLSRWLTMKAESPGNLLLTGLDLVGLDGPLMAARERRRDPQIHRHFRLLPGVLELVTELSERYRLGLVTTRNRAFIDEFLADQPAVARAVGASCGLQDTRRLKPHPAPVLLAAARLQVAPERCLMVGDTTVDVRAGRRAGAWTAAVLCGFGERRELARAGAHLILEQTADLSAWL